MLTIRPITKDDIPSCLDIYNYEVVNGVATLDLEPRTLPEWQEWYKVHQTQEHCIFVGLIDDVVVGYASLSPYRTKDAFKSTVELSIYIHQDYRGKSVASKLMANMPKKRKHYIRWCLLLRQEMRQVLRYMSVLDLPTVD